MGEAILEFPQKALVLLLAQEGGFQLDFHLRKAGGQLFQQPVGSLVLALQLLGPGAEALGFPLGEVPRLPQFLPPLGEALQPAFQPDGILGKGLFPGFQSGQFRLVPADLPLGGEKLLLQFPDLGIQGAHFLSEGFNFGAAAEGAGGFCRRTPSEGAPCVDQLAIQRHHPELIPGPLGDGHSGVQILRHNHPAKKPGHDPFKTGIVCNQVSGQPYKPRLAGEGADVQPVSLHRGAGQEGGPPSPVPGKLPDGRLGGFLILSHNILHGAA